MDSLLSKVNKSNHIWQTHAYSANNKNLRNKKAFDSHDLGKKIGLTWIIYSFAFAVCKNIEFNNILIVKTQPSQAKQGWLTS